MQRNAGSEANLICLIKRKALKICPKEILINITTVFLYCLPQFFVVVVILKAVNLAALLFFLHISFHDMAKCPVIPMTLVFLM